MKICITSEGQTLEDQVDPHLGRAVFFLLVDTDTMSCQAMPNEAGQAQGGAGVRAAEQIIRAGAKAVLTGHCGPHACRTLQAVGVEIYSGLSGTVRQALQAFQEGRLKPDSQPSGPAHGAL